MYKKYPKGLKITPEKEHLVLDNLGIARKLAHKWYNGVVEFDDLLQQAYLILSDCATKYDITMGNKFNTYAYRCIDIVLNNYVQNYNKLIKIPLNKIYKIHEYLNKPEAEKETFRIESNLTLEDIKFYTTYEKISMDAQVVDEYDDVSNFYECEENQYEDLENRLIIKQIIDNLGKFIKNETERLVFTEVILNDFDKSAYKEIAKTYNLKVSDVTKIIERCQKVMAENKGLFL